MTENPNMELVRQVREAMEDEGFTLTTTNGWIGTVSDVARLARDHARLTAEVKLLQAVRGHALRLVSQHREDLDDLYKMLDADDLAELERLIRA